jgi:hypothetical protein
MVEGKKASSWASPIPRCSREYKSGYDFRLHQWRPLEGEDDPLLDVEDDDDECRVRSLRFGQQRRGEGQQFPQGEWTSLARDQREL